MNRQQKTRVLSDLIELHLFNAYRREASGVLELGIPINVDTVIWEAFPDENTMEENKKLCLNLILRAKQQGQLI